MYDSPIEHTQIEFLRHKLAVRWKRHLAWHEVEELVSEVLEAYCSKSCDGTRIEKPVAWLLGAADRLGLRMISRLAKVHEHEKHEDAKSLAEKEDRRYQNVQNHDDSTVNDLLNLISVEQREIVKRCVMHDMPVADAARELGMNYSTARSHMVRGLGRLRRDACSILSQFPQAEAQRN